MDGVVIPTRVGMVRKRSLSRYVMGRLSPRAWGWSVLPSLDLQRTIVIPTRVGMVRARGWVLAIGRVIPTRVGMVRGA